MQTHHSDVIWESHRLQSPETLLSARRLVQAYWKIKAPHYWPLVKRIHRKPIDFPHRWHVKRKLFPFYNVMTAYMDQGPVILCDLTLSPASWPMVAQLSCRWKLHCHYLIGLRQHNITVVYDDVIKWKHFPRYWPFVWGIHRSPVNCPHKGQWRGALMLSLICA